MMTLLPPPEVHLTEFHGILTTCDIMRDLFQLITRVARTDAPVLVRGETGSGKELVARAVHRLSGRADAPFRAINCATLTGEMLASELFGHRRGAFTGAVKDRKGLFELADRGTLFLDELAELPLDLQARLLRVLQEQSFMPLGGDASAPIHVDIRFVSATHVALRRAVSQRRFREDLMYRLRVVPIFLPPLRDRPGDVNALTWHFVGQLNAAPRAMRQITHISRDVMEAMCVHPWPGNVRELTNVLTYAFAVGEGPHLLLKHLPPELRGEGPDDERAYGDNDNDNDSVRGIERERVRQALMATGGKKADAATRLGMSRTTLWRKLREFGLA